MRTSSASRLIPLIIVMCTAAAPVGAEVIFDAAADSCIGAGTNQNTNFGSATRLTVRRQRFHHALVRFDEAAIAAAAGEELVLSATLELFAESAASWPAAGGDLSAHAVARPWTESGVTWNCPDDLEPRDRQIDCAIPWGGGAWVPAPSATAAVHNATRGIVAFDVTLDVRAFLAGEPNFGWVVKKLDENANGRIDFTSREGSAIRRPRLRVEFALELPTATPSPTPTAIPPPSTVAPSPAATPTPAVSPAVPSGHGSSGGGGCILGGDPTPSDAWLLASLLLPVALHRARAFFAPR